METTRRGNIKIEVNPERKYRGQFVGYEYYRLADCQGAFPSVGNFPALSCDGNNLSDLVNNEEMIQHHIQPYRRIGYICK